MGKPYLSGTNVLVFNKPTEKAADALANYSKVVQLIKNTRSLNQALKIKAMLKVADIEAQRKEMNHVREELVDLEYTLKDKTGEIIERMKKTGELATGPVTEGKMVEITDSTGTKQVPVQTLADIGVSKNESSDAQKFHKLPKEKQDQKIKAAKENLGKKRRKIIKATAEGHVHKFVCSCGAVAP